MAGAATTQTTEINGNSEKSSHPFHCSKEQEGNTQDLRLPISLSTIFNHT